jgi:hypothetical protein
MKPPVIFNKTHFFSKVNGKVKQVFSGDWKQWEGGGHKERVK